MLMKKTTYRNYLSERKSAEIANYDEIIEMKIILIY